MDFSLNASHLFRYASELDPRDKKKVMTEQGVVGMF